MFISVAFLSKSKNFSPLEDVRIGAGAELPGQWVTDVLSAGVNLPVRAAEKPLGLVLSGRIGGTFL